MRNFLCLPVFFLFFAPVLHAQNPLVIKIANQCSTQLLKKNLFHIASSEMEGRLMASHGDTLASLFVAAAFKKAGLAAPYNKTYFQTVRAEKKVIEGSLQLNDKIHAYTDGWKLFPSEPISLKNIEVICSAFANADEISAYILSHEVNGKAIIIPETIMLKILADNSIDSLETIWKNKGLAALVWSGKTVDKSIDYIKRQLYVGQYKNDLLDPIFEPGGANVNAMPEIGLSKEMMQELLQADNIRIQEDNSFAGMKQVPVTLKTKISVTVSTSFSEVTAPNLIGVMKGQDTSLPVVILSAHHDHNGKGADGIYYGAVDNASGTVAIMEIARLLQQAAKQGLRTKRSIVFASFTGEERGELGSSYYVNNPLYPLSQTYGVMNIDMMGRVDTFYSGKRADSSYAYFLIKDTAHQFRKSLFDANKELNELTLDARYEDPRYMRRRLEGSDQFPFYLKGIPFIRIDCGFAKEYHQTTDTPEKINYELLAKQVKLALVTLYNIANE